MFHHSPNALLQRRYSLIKGKVCELQIDTRKLKKLIIKAVPYVAFSYVGNLIGFAYRTAEGNGFQEKILPFMSNLGVAFARIFPSLHPFDLLFGLVLAGVMRLVLYVKSKNRKKFRQGEEYGSAVWGGEKDIEPYMDLSCPENNVILTRTESLTMGKPSAPKFARNKNILVIGGSGSGKTRFFVKPNLMQMHSSYVVTDPKGTVLVECGKMLERGRPKRVNGKVVYRRDDKGNYLKDKNGRYIPVYEPYKIKVFNTIDFAKSIQKISRFSIYRNRFLKEFIMANPPDFPISNKCCEYAKKKPAKRIVKEHDADLDITGIRQAEGGIRSAAFKTCFSECKSKGCNTFRPVFWYTDGDKRDYEEIFGVTHSRCYTEYGLRRTGCVGCPFSKHITEELAVIEEHEPMLYKAAVNIFGKSYEYTAKYRAFVKEMKAKEKEEKKRDRLHGINGTSACDTGGNSGAGSSDRSAVSADNNAPEIKKGA